MDIPNPLNLLASVAIALNDVIHTLHLQEALDRARNDGGLSHVSRSTFNSAVLSTQVMECVSAINWIFEEDLTNLLRSSDYAIWRLTGETEESFYRLVGEIQQVIERGHGVLNMNWPLVRRNLAVFLIYMRQYPTYKTLGCMFGLNERDTNRVVHKMLTVRKVPRKFLIPDN